MAKPRSSIPSPVEVGRVLRDEGHPYLHASMRPLTSILKTLRTTSHIAPQEAQALVNAMLVQQAHINSLERKLEETSKHVSAGLLRRI